MLVSSLYLLHHDNAPALLFPISISFVFIFARGSSNRERERKREKPLPWCLRKKISMGKANRKEFFNNSTKIQVPKKDWMLC